MDDSSQISIEFPDRHFLNKNQNNILTYIKELQKSRVLKNCGHVSCRNASPFLHWKIIISGKYELHCARDSFNWKKERCSYYDYGFKYVFKGCPEKCLCRASVFKVKILNVTKNVYKKFSRVIKKFWECFLSLPRLVQTFIAFAFLALMGLLKTELFF